MDDAGRRARNRGAVGATTHEHGTVKERRERDEATKRMVRLAWVRDRFHLRESERAPGHLTIGPSEAR